MIRSGSIVDIISEVTSVGNPKNSTAPQFHTLHDPRTKHVGLWPLSDYWPCRSRSSWLGHSQKTDPLNLIYQKPIPAVAGWQNILRQILFELDNIASIPAWASRSSTLLFVRATDFQAQPIPDRFLQKLLRQFSIFAVVFPVVWQIWDFGKRCKVFLICVRVRKVLTITPGHNPVNRGFGVQKSAWMYHSAIAVYNFIWFLLNAVSRFCNIYSCDRLCKSGHCSGDQGRLMAADTDQISCVQ